MLVYLWAVIRWPIFHFEAKLPSTWVDCQELYLPDDEWELGEAYFDGQTQTLFFVVYLTNDNRQ